MATKKSASTAKKSAKRPASAAAKKTTTTKVKTVSTSATTAKVKSSRGGVKLPNNIVNIVLAEIVGTFVLTAAALFAVQLVAPLYVGLTLAVLVFAIGAISGSHVNPAVTFGLWAARRVKGILVPFYWVAQFIGAMAAVVAMSAIASTQLGLSFDHFQSLNWSIFTVELIGTAVFLFGLTAVLLRDEIQAGAKALGIGLALTIGLVVASSLLAPVGANTDQSQIEAKTDEATGRQTLSNVPHTLRVDSVTLNPAVALAATEKTDSQLQGSAAAKGETRYSRLTLEVILGTLLGAAIGANLYVALAGRLRK